MNENQEIWKDVKGFEGIYQVSNFGRVKSFNWKNTGKEKVMKPAFDKKGYLRTVFCKNKKRKTVKIHRIIAQTFIHNPEKKETVNHLDGVKDNNRVDNLEWATQSENCKHAVKMGLIIVPCHKKYKHLTTLKGEKNGSSKLTEKEVLEIRLKFKPRVYTRDILSKEYGVAPTTIKDIVLKRTWKHI